MPCLSDYMEPSGKEKKLQETAQLILFVNDSLKKPTDDWIIKESQNEYCKKESLVPHLCELIHSLTVKQKNSIIYNGKNPTSRKLADWWDQHLESDQKRIELEISQKHKKIQDLADSINQLNENDRILLQELINTQSSIKKRPKKSI